MVYKLCMEKRRPTYDLKAFKAACAIELNITVAAQQSAARFGFNQIMIQATIQSMEASHFYKSMTSHGDHKIWQDVYHVLTLAGVIYIKFTADGLTDFLVLSFKEKYDD